jgi:CP family cyanate transporter-like MFS transporter
MAEARSGAAASGRRLHRTGGLALLVAGMLALAVNLRAAITGLPPVFPELSAALHLSSGTIALLAATPVLCFGLFSGLGAPLSRRFGEERVLLAGLLLLGAGLLLRGAAPEVMLFPGTVLAGAAIALGNVLLPSLIKRRHPGHAGLLIGAYLLTMSSGAVVGALIAVPVYQAAAGSTAAVAGWPVQLTLGLWALPALAAAVAWLPQVRYRTVPGPLGPESDGLEAEGLETAGPEATGPETTGPETTGPGPAGPDNATADRHRVSRRTPVNRHLLAWQVAAFMGLQSLTYYAALSWLPTLFRDRGVSPEHAGDLLALMNLGNAVTAMLMPVLAHRARDQRVLVVAAALASAVGLTGALLAPVGTAFVWTLLLGLGQGASLGLAIFFTVARAPDPVASASLSGFAQSVGYLIATGGPLAIGVLHTATGGWDVPVMALLGATVVQLSAGVLAGRARTLPGLARPS